MDNWFEKFKKKIVENSFFKLCELIALFISKNTTHMCQPISRETQVAASLYYLSYAELMRETTNSFGNSIGKSSVSCIVKNVTKIKCQDLGS